MALCSTGGAWTLVGPAVSMTSKKDLSERDICRIYITPAITGGGWDGQTQIRENVYLTAGRVIVRGKLAKRSEKRKFADYVLYRGDTPIAIVEAKDNNQVVGAGMQQALEYAEMVDVPFVFSSNGDAFLFHDRTGRSTQPGPSTPSGSRSTRTPCSKGSRAAFSHRTRSSLRVSGVVSPSAPQEGLKPRAIHHRRSAPGQQSSASTH
jgi:type I site-specific restriction endonuclease